MMVRTVRRSAFATLVALVAIGGVASGCSGADPAPASDPAACPSFVVPTSLGLAWQNLNHRVSRWGLHLAPAPGEACAAHTLEATYVGGDYTTGETATDTPLAHWAGMRFDLADTQVVGAARLRVHLDVGPDGEATTVVSSARDALNLRGFSTVVALIEGLALTTDVPQDADYPAGYEPAHGYTSRGLGAWARVTELTEDAVAIEAGVRFAHGPSDREDMNAAIPHARTAATLDLLLVGVAGAPVVEGDVSTIVTCPKPPFLQDVPCPEPPEADTRLVVQGPPGPWQGVAGWTRFVFAFETPDDPGHGEYLRDVRVQLDRLAVDEASGRATFRAVGYASHASKFAAFYSLETRFQGAIAWVQAPVDGVALRVDQAFATGDASFALAPEAP